MTIACMEEGKGAIFDPSGNSHFFIVKRNRPDGETGNQTPMTYIVDLGHNVDIINMAMAPNVFVTIGEGSILLLINSLKSGRYGLTIKAMNHFIT